MTVSGFILDASITLAWCFDDEGSDRAVRILERLDQDAAFVPPIWQLEVGNALLGAERRGRLKPAESTNFIDLLRNLPISVEEIPPYRTWGEIINLARTYHLSTYDAAYLDLAMRLGLPLASLDNALNEAAGQCGVEIF